MMPEQWAQDTCSSSRGASSTKNPMECEVFARIGQVYRERAAAKAGCKKSG